MQFGAPWWGWPSRSVAALVVLGLTAFGLSGKGAEQRCGSTPRCQGPRRPPRARCRTRSSKLATYPDSMAGEHGIDGGAHPDWVSYGPSTNLHVPAHSLVTVTIDQYDGGEKITNPYFAKVHGTVGGTDDGRRQDRDRRPTRSASGTPSRSTRRPATRTRCS